MYNKIIKLPINSSKEYMQNKKCDYKILALLTLYSELNDDCRIINCIDLYKKENIDNIEKLSNMKIDTIKRKIRFLNKNISKLINTKDNIITIKYSENFITIEKDILKLLINKTNSNTIKAYILLKYMCRFGMKDIHRVYIAEQIGLSTNSQSLKVISKITNKLEELGLIKKFDNYKIVKNDGKQQCLQVNKYSVSNYSQWYTYMLNNKLDIMKELNMNIGSKGELAIADYLDSKSINYIREYTFKDLKGDKGLLRFDFYLPDENILIEFDGKQHDKYIKFMHEDESNFNKIQKYDEKKVDYANKNGIKLIKIKYDDIYNVEQILKQTLYN